MTPTVAQSRRREHGPVPAINEPSSLDDALSLCPSGHLSCLSRDYAVRYGVAR
jgi:hypothetical protein